MAVTFPKNERVKRELDGNYKLLIYSAPGVGKTYFAERFPEPLLLSTDGNWRFTNIPAMVVSKWKSSKTSSDEEVNTSFENIVNALVEQDGAGFKTVIVDLVEDLYKMAVEDTLKERSIASLGDLPYGQGYIETRSKFYKVYKKLISLPVNVILLSHEKDEIVKDRLGRESTYFRPKLDDDTLDLLSGSGFTLRAFWDSSLNEKNVKVMQRRLIMGSTPDCFGVTRFSIPVEATETIPLDFEAFETYMKFHNAESDIKPSTVKEVPIKLQKENIQLPGGVKTKTPIATPTPKPVVEKPVVEETPTPVVEKPVVKETPKVTPAPTPKPIVEKPTVVESEEDTADVEVSVTDERQRKIDEIMKKFNKFTK